MTDENEEVVNKEKVIECLKLMRKFNGTEVYTVLNNIPFDNLISINCMIARILHDKFYAINENLSNCEDVTIQ